jgi:hypothetical protein
MSRPELMTRFREASGQKPGALYWVLKGAPGKWQTISAACDVLNSVYSNLAKAVPTTVLPREHKSKMGIYQPVGPSQYLGEMEFLPEIGPAT